jgi:GT2 family glycosyltransferase
MIPDLVSAVIPVHNRPRQLREAVESVLEQDYRPIEMIIIDDGSTDDTIEAAQELAVAHPEAVRVISQANSGPGAAREKGRLLARGEFIQYLDSDDILLPGKFRAQVEALRSTPQADVAYGITYLREADGLLVEMPHKKTGEPISAMFPEFLVSRWWETATPLYRSSVTDKAGAWTDLRIEEDWEYDCRVASLGGKLAWVPQPVSEHRDHAGQRLSRGSAIDKQRLRQRSQAHGLILKHAIAFGLTPECPQMQNFARALFLLARQCGAAGLPVESRELLHAARRACGAKRARGLDFRVYKSIAGLLGWTAAGKASAWLDKFREGSP